MNKKGIINPKKVRNQNYESKKMNNSDNLKKMHLEVTEELLLPKPDDVKILMNKMDQLLKLIESK